MTHLQRLSLKLEDAHVVLAYFTVLACLMVLLYHSIASFEKMPTVILGVVPVYHRCLRANNCMCSVCLCLYVRMCVLRFISFLFSYYDINMCHLCFLFLTLKKVR